MSKDAKRQKLQRRRERDFREKKISRAYEQPRPPKSVRKNVVVQSYHVTFEAITNQKDPMMSLHALLGEDVMQDLHRQSMEEPSIAIPRLRRLIEDHPNVPPLYNWLAVAYVGAGDTEKSDEINRLNYERNPEYLFAFVNHCVRLMVEGQVKQVTEVLNGRYDLQQFHPDRNLFHITEALGFYYMMVMYYVTVGKLQPAESLTRIMEQLAPESDQALAARAMVASKLRISVFSDMFSKVGRRRDAVPRFSAGAR